MDPDPRPADETPLPPDQGASQPSSRAPRPRLGSSMIARLVTLVYALVVTPIAVALLSYGGSTWVRVYMSSGYVDEPIMGLLRGMTGARVGIGLGLGILLIASVAVSGLLSSAGLLVAGALGLVGLVISAVPSLLVRLYGIAPSALPLEILDGFAVGLPIALLLVLGGLGIALVIARRRPDVPTAVSALGLVLVPLVLLVGAGLLFAGVGRGTRSAIVMFDGRMDPLATALVLVGGLLLCLGAALSWASPYSLLLPAVVLVAATAPLAVPTLMILPSWMVTDLTGVTVTSFLLMGGGAATAAALLVHTVVLAIARRRARRIRRESAAPTTGPVGDPGVGGPDPVGPSGAHGAPGTGG